ncbi:hypothetical protein D1Z90_11360 [Motilimonas pumila]|uniref:Uncharacterized protein n=1 Tax=Motilimonas pumila TaxID=2303987 RepID=A0A418YED7_9GAMM|nr:hypothetical protein D1Z90_11360 [Motilimonas pumila]
MTSGVGVTTGVGVTSGVGVLPELSSELLEPPPQAPRNREVIATAMAALGVLNVILYPLL